MRALDRAMIRLYVWLVVTADVMKEKLASKTKEEK